MDRYPVYNRGEVIKLYNELPPKDKKILDDFCSSCATSSNPQKVKDIKRSILQFHHVTGKSYTAVTLADLRHFLTLLNQSDREEWSKHDIKLHLKRFLKATFKDWSERFNELKELKNGRISVNQEKINPKTYLKKDEIETIMRKENDLTLKAFFITLYESGMRPSELRKARWKDITLNIDGDLSEINIFMTKNKKAKTVYVKQATFYLKKLQSDAQGDYIFPSRENKNVPIGDSTATRWINDLGKHINRHIYPYLLRHTRASELYKLVNRGKLSDTVTQKFLGHSKSMQEIYSQLDTDTLKETITKTVYNFEELPPEQVNDLRKRVEELEKAISKISKLVQLRDK